MSIRRHFLVTISSLAAAIAPVISRSQTWPSQPLRLVVTFPPGGASDIVARLIGGPLQARLVRFCFAKKDETLNAALGRLARL